MGESSPPLVAPRKGEVGSALPKMGSMIPPTGGTTTTTTTTTTARTLDDLADLRDLDEDALLQALQDDSELAEMVYREFEGELRREREEEEEGGGDGGGGGGGGRGSAATEEERAARRERIRARQVARKRGGEPVAGAEAGEGPAFRRGPGGSAQRRVGGTHREEILVGMREGGVPVKSWLLITAALGLGLYRLFGMLREPDRARSPGKRGSPERRRRMAGRSTGRESGEEALASIPQEWLEGGEGGAGPSPKRGRKAGRKRRSPRRTPRAAPGADAGPGDGAASSDEDEDEDEVGEVDGSDAAAEDGPSPPRTSFSGGEEVRPAAIPDPPGGGEGWGGDPDSLDGGGWQTAGRRARGGRAGRERRQAQAAPAAEETAAARPPPPPPVPAPGTDAAADAAADADALPPSQSDGSASPDLEPEPDLDDAALAKRLQLEEDRIAAEVGPAGGRTEDDDEEWAEVPRRKGRKREVAAADAGGRAAAAPVP